MQTTANNSYFVVAVVAGGSNGMLGLISLDLKITYFTLSVVKSTK